MAPPVVRGQADAAGRSRGMGPGRLSRLRISPLVRSRKFMIGFAIVAIFAIIAVIGPLLAPYGPSAMSHQGLKGPSGQHLLGTTQTGQDVLSELLVGTRVTLLVGFVAALIASAISIIIGVASGYLGGVADEFLSMLSNVFLVIPALPLVIVLAAYLTQEGSLAIAVVIAVTGWAWGARVLRAQTLSIRARDYVLAAKETGERTWRILLVEILPNEAAIVASGFLFAVIFAILTQAGLNFLGLGSLTSWSWGSMLYFAQNNEAFSLGAWWWYMPPGLCIALVGTGLALINFGLDEFMNPRLRTAALPEREQRPARPATAPVIAAPGLILEVRDLAVDYGHGPAAVHAVDGVSLEVRRGEVLGLVGESGSGKSTLAYAASRLLRPPGRATRGSIIYHPEQGEPVDVLALPDDELRQFRWDELSIVFQSAMNVLNPVLDVGTQLTDAIEAHRLGVSAEQLRARAEELLTTVGIPADRRRAFPHELSGGMRQRVVIAMALALEPRIVVLDEPTTALDVVTQREIMERLISLRERFGFSVIFITHDLSLLIEVADRIAVMYAGRIVEVAAARDLYRHPQHPYTKGLIASFPALHGPQERLTGIPGSPPDMREVPAGCAFHPRCPHAMPRCQEGAAPVLAVTGDNEEGRMVSCFLNEPGGTLVLPVRRGDG